MSTAIATVQRSDFLSLSGGGDAKLAMDAMSETGEPFGPNDLIRIKTPSGGATSWMVPGPSGEVPEREIVGALVHYQRCGVLWPSEEMGQGQMPVLRSWDMTTGEQVGPIPDHMAEVLEEYRIEGNKFHVAESSGFPYSQWGSGKGGIGKRMKEQRMLFVLPKDNLAPYLIICQPGSLKTVGEWFKRIPQVCKVPWWRVLVSLKLQKTQSKGGQSYAQIIPETAGILDAETGAELHKTWGELLSRVAKQVELTPESDE